MLSYYRNTSALVKAYARESGSAWVGALIEPAQGHILYTVRLTGSEMVAALERKARTACLPALRPGEGCQRRPRRGGESHPRRADLHTQPSA